MLTDYAILGAVLGGILAFAVGLYRIAEQADLLYRGISDEILTTSEQRRRLSAQKTQRFWDVFWSPRRKFDRYLIIAGGATMAVAILIVATIAS